MIKLLEMWNRRLDMTHEQAVHHWLNVHGPLVKKTLGSKIVKYVTNVGLPLDVRGWSKEEAPPYDGIAEFWLDVTVDELDAMIRESAHILQPDERSFIGTYRPMLVKEVFQKE
jgi:uncharacterized protein (TIGR02118 family)